MSKLHVDQNKISKCQHCGNLNIWLIRRDNLNHTLTDDDIRFSARNLLGTDMNEWCEQCDMFTYQIVVAFDMKPKDTPNEE